MTKFGKARFDQVGVGNSEPNMFQVGQIKGFWTGAWVGPVTKGGDKKRCWVGVWLLLNLIGQASSSHALSSQSRRVRESQTRLE